MKIFASLSGGVKSKAARGIKRNAGKFLEVNKEIKELINAAFKSKDIPSEGKAKTWSGEILRALNEIIYQNHNNGCWPSYRIKWPENTGQFYAVGFLAEKIAGNPVIVQKYATKLARAVSEDECIKLFNLIQEHILYSIKTNPAAAAARNSLNYEDSRLGDRYVDESNDFWAEDEEDDY